MKTKKISVKVSTFLVGLALLFHKINLKLLFTVSASLFSSFILNGKGLALNGCEFEAESVWYYLGAAIISILSLYYADDVIETESPRGPERWTELFLLVLFIGVLLSLLIRFIFGFKFDISLFKSFNILMGFMGNFTLFYECTTKFYERKTTCLKN